MRHRQPKKMFANKKSDAGQLAHALSISLYPSHMQLLKQREAQLGVPKSILLQLLLELDAKGDLLRRELIARLTAVDPGPNMPTE